ncbi:hypothetical protein DNTS_030091 [Danionella cerebrum]|uniref:Nidogen-1 n=1 Tax=Danionella cerebrum TaxID=2873325 RepID=A0A553Q1S8_9TELE|nr:hypothetical protein DNTS_030091 [Danionella translucida]TRY83858.1 hypothetical protein DNTS_030091 [Danionella translucida]
MGFMCSVVLLALLVSVQCLTLEQLFDYGVRFGDQVLDSGTDSVRDLALEQTLFFFKGKFNKVYISTNGFISVSEPEAESEYLGKMPAKFGMLAAFLGDLYTSDGVGQVYFRQDKSPEVLQRAREHIKQAFPSEEEIEPSHTIIITWENVSPQGERARGDFLEFLRNTFQMVVVNLESASYVLLLYPEETMQFDSMLINDEDQYIQVGFNEGLVSGWFRWSKTQGVYYRITEDSEESINALTQETNSGVAGVWVYKIGSTPTFTDILPGQVKEVLEVTEVAVIDTPAPGSPYETLTYRPEVFSESSTPDETQNRFLQPEENIQQTVNPQQPQNPQVLIIDEDELNVNVFSYNYETCSSNQHKCSVFADCRDYTNGFCCHCKPGYYGNGKDCVAEGKPQRMNGKVNGRIFIGSSSTHPVEFSGNDLHSYVVANDGRAYIAISSVPAAAGPSLQPLHALGEAIGWAFALEQPGYHNGFRLIGGVFDRQTEVVFQPGNERLTIRQQFSGIDEHDHLQINTVLEGRIPEIPRGATVQIQPYTEIYQHSSSLITSSSRREYIINMPDGRTQTHSYLWTQNIRFEGCPHEDILSTVPSSQQLSVDQVFVMYDSGNQLIRFAMSNKIGSIHSGVPEQNPCFTGRHGCDTNAVCRPAQGKEFTCECAAGFTGDGRVCYDVDECSETPQICGPFSVCNNQPGSFRCECKDGFQFAGDGRTCIESEHPVNHCERGTHDCDVPDRARCSFTGASNYICSCLPGFTGDGRVCHDIDECQPGRCHSDAICYNTQGSFSCQCRPGFHGDGFSCTTDAVEGKTACQRERESALSTTSSSSSGGFFFFRPRPSVGHFIPVCDKFGGYEPTQCHASVGQCWCVDSNGREIPGSRSSADSRPLCIDHNVAPPVFGPTPRPGIGPLTPGSNLIFAQSGRIEHIPLEGNRMKREEARTLLHVPGKVVIAVAFDCMEQTVYWSDITQPAISRAKMEGGQTSVLVSRDLGSPEGIAIDHVSRNMYWTDSILDRIEVSRLDGSHRRILFEDDLINPRPIIADPANGLLYWADWNRDGPKIERSSLDGTRKVECIDPFSHVRRKLSEAVHYPFAIASHGRNLYYTDWIREAVVAVDRHDGTELQEFLPQRRSRTYGITITYPQCPAEVNYCSRNNGGCSHLCLPRPGGFTCRCPNSPVDSSCVEQDQNF